MLCTNLAPGMSYIKLTHHQTAVAAQRQCHWCRGAWLRPLSHDVLSFDFRVGKERYIHTRMWCKGDGDWGIHQLRGGWRSAAKCFAAA